MKRWKKLFALMVCLAMLACMLPLQASAGDNFPAILAEAKKGVVQIYGLGNNGIFWSSWIGSGFAVGETGKPTDVFLTNWHVVTDEDFSSSQIKIWILQENCQIDNRTGEPDPNKSISCEVLKTTTGYPDYAIIRATEPVSNYMPLPLMSSKEVLDGTKVYALGYPAIVGDASASHYGIDDITSTDGIISQHMQYALAGNTWVLMHTAQISGGNSGGPLITAEGVVVGLNTYGFGESEANMNRYCAVYIDYAIEGLDELGLPYTLAGAGDPIIPESDPTESTSDDQDKETTKPDKEDDSKNDEDEEGEDSDDEDEEIDWIPIIAAGGGGFAILLIIIIIVASKKKQEEQRRQEAERRYQAEQRRLEEERRQQEEQRRRQEEEQRRRLEEERRRFEDERRRQEAQLRKEQEVKAQLQLSGGPIYPVRATGCLIGRERDCSIVLPEGTSGVSRHHCKLEYRSGQLILVDLNSTYGTYIHGKRIPANTPVALKPGSSFCLGSEKCRFTVC